MSKALVLTLCLVVVSGCATVETTVETVQAPVKPTKFSVEQIGTKQNTEFVLCDAPNCAQRTPKYLPSPAPAAKKVKAQTIGPTVASVKNVQFKVHFRLGWSRLDADGIKEVRDMIASGALKSASSIVVAGRTDPTGSIKFNEKLALRRAQTVKDALVVAGYPAEAISAVAQKPCCDGDLGASKGVMQKLRRTDVDITVTTK